MPMDESHQQSYYNHHDQPFWIFGNTDIIEIMTQTMRLKLMKNFGT